ncbi:MAG: cation efflux family-domain-containing protein [Olpidium bornovanus]|uniref:Cation efflux family-domain-containing protein n=1 Tax=Olpidium bornovanus TaxID=278681 RepID=A0A8H7ZYM0_9FUNG|nr:MAG: cation efflux family-domain-containing protein [Olpidium bornovanus]
MRAATLHVIGDLLSSVGVLIASVVIMLGGPSQVDPVCTFLFSAMVFATTVGVAKESISVLMEGAPREADVLGLVASLRALPGVVNVHGLHGERLKLDDIVGLPAGRDDMPDWGSCARPLT